MSSGHTVSFANFICKFGDDKNLLDVAESIVLPAFLNVEDLQPRSYQDTKYFFFQTQLLNLGDKKHPILAIAGRFVKDTTLRREQVFSPTLGLIKKTGKLESSPSAIFVLLLNNHKLIYYPETAFAPALSSFRSTAYSYIRQSQKIFVNAEFYRRKNAQDELLARGESPGPQVTKKSIWEEYPISSLEVVPIPSEMSLADFVLRYKELASISLKVLQTNSELDNSQLLAAVRKTGSKLGAKNSQVTHTAVEKKGLNRDEAVVQLRAVALDGNVDVRLSGTDASGNKLIGNNEEFRLRVYTDEVSDHIPVAARQLNDVFREETASNNIRVASDANPEITAEAIYRIAQNRNLG